MMKPMHTPSTLAPLALFAMLACVTCPAVSTAQDEARQRAANEPPLVRGEAVPRFDSDPTPEARLWREVSGLLDELQRLRTQLAHAQLEAEEARRELAELRRFIEDHETYGRDFEQYRAVREIAEREQRRRAAEEARERRAIEEMQRRARAEELRVVREAQREEARRLRQYREAGFIGLGLNVYISRVSYYYPTRDLRTRFQYEPDFGRLLRFQRTDEIDFSQMTISGAIVNAAHETRNIGVAIVFFDERGVQVGQETIHVANARPEVPYPFTSTVVMAMDRPFTSSTSYVLYADAIEDDPPASDDGMEY